MTLYVLFCKGFPVAVSKTPFKLPSYGDKISLCCVMYSPLNKSEECTLNEYLENIL